jgi:glutathione S-transferase
MKLYNNKLSTNCKRVRVVANELGINLNLIELDFMKGENKTPQYLAKNPMGKIPTFEDDDGYTLWESTAIITYLASKNPQKNLIPTDAKGRAEIARWTHWNANHFEAAVHGVMYEKMIKPMFGGEADATRVEEHSKDYERFAPILNAALEGKTWLVGDHISIADISLGVIVEAAQAVGLDVTKFSHIKSWYGRLSERDSWKKS